MILPTGRPDELKKGVRKNENVACYWLLLNASLLKNATDKPHFSKKCFKLNSGSTLAAEGFRINVFIQMTVKKIFSSVLF